MTKKEWEGARQVQKGNDHINTGTPGQERSIREVGNREGFNSLQILTGSMDGWKWVGR